MYIWSLKCYSYKKKTYFSFKYFGLGSTGSSSGSMMGTYTFSAIGDIMMGETGEWIEDSNNSSPRSLNSSLLRSISSIVLLHAAFLKNILFFKQISYFLNKISYFIFISYPLSNLLFCQFYKFVFLFYFLLCFFL